MIPQRIQRKRTKGWKMPPNTIYVGRPTVWGNPFLPQCKISEDYRNKLVQIYRLALCGGGFVSDRMMLESWVKKHGWIGGFN